MRIAEVKMRMRAQLTWSCRSLRRPKVRCLAERPVLQRDLHRSPTHERRPWVFRSLPRRRTRHCWIWKGCRRRPYLQRGRRPVLSWLARHRRLPRHSAIPDQVCYVSGSNAVAAGRDGAGSRVTGSAILAGSGRVTGQCVRPGV